MTDLLLVFSPTHLNFMVPTLVMSITMWLQVMLNGLNRVALE